MLVLFDIDGTLLLRASAEHAAALRERSGGLRRRATARAGRRRRAHRHRDRTRSRGARRRRAASASTPASRVQGRLRRGASPGSARRASRDASRPGMAELLDALAGARRRALLAGDRQLRAGRAAEARARRDRPPFRSRARAASARTPSTATSCRAIARARAGGYPRERTIVIGDTPLDIACARADGLRVLAVATGIYTADELTRRRRRRRPTRFELAALLGAASASARSAHEPLVGDALRAVGLGARAARGGAPRRPRSCPRTSAPGCRPRTRARGSRRGRGTSGRGRSRRRSRRRTAAPPRARAACRRRGRWSARRAAARCRRSRRSFARCRRLRSPPESFATFFCWSEPRKLNDAAYWRELTQRSPTLIWSWPPEISSQTRAFVGRARRATGRRRRARRCRRSAACRRRAAPRR